MNMNEFAIIISLHGVFIERILEREGIWFDDFLVVACTYVLWLWLWLWPRRGHFFHHYLFAQVAAEAVQKGPEDYFHTFKEPSIYSLK